MINSKEDLRFFLDADKFALERKGKQDSMGMKYGDSKLLLENVNIIRIKKE